MIDLNHLGQYRENNRIEAKKALGGLPHSIWETYSAFANTLGGLILLGVEEREDKSLHALDLPDPEQIVEDFWTQVNDPCRASANILSAEDVSVETADGKHIVVINVPRAERSRKPVYVDGETRNTYRRSGEGDYRCTREEYQAMVREASVQTQDMLVLEDMGTGVFNAESIRSYRRRMMVSRPDPVWDRLSDEAFLVKLGAVCPGSDGRMRPTCAGLLMFGSERDILRAYPQYALAYSETRVVSSDGAWNGNIFDFYCYVYGKLQWDLRLPNALRRGAAPGDTPVHRAVREALTNCLVNADYHGSGGVVITRKKNALVLSNPGGFRIGIAAAKSGGLSDPRNGALSEMFRLLNVGKGSGSGIPDIFRVWRELGWAEPTIVQSSDPARTTLTLRLSPEGGKPTAVGDTEATQAVKRQLIIDYLTEHPGAGLDELAEYVGCKPSVVQDHLAELTLEHIVIAEGESRERTYRLKA